MLEGNLMLLIPDTKYPRPEERRVGKECRSRDWSSDVCSSDLIEVLLERLTPISP